MSMFIMLSFRQTGTAKWKTRRKSVPLPYVGGSGEVVLKNVLEEDARETASLSVARIQSSG